MIYQEFHLKSYAFKSLWYNYTPPPPTEAELLQIMQSNRWFAEFWDYEWYEVLTWEIDPYPEEMEPPWEQTGYPEWLFEERLDDPFWITVDEKINSWDYELQEFEEIVKIRYVYETWWHQYYQRPDDMLPYCPGMFEAVPSPLLMFMLLFAGAGAGAGGRFRRKKR